MARKNPLPSLLFSVTYKLENIWTLEDLYQGHKNDGALAASRKEENTMETVSQDELLEWINLELSKYEECNDCRVTSVVRLKGEDENGCNWSSKNLNCSGIPADVCSPVANKVIAHAKMRFNLK